MAHYKGTNSEADRVLQLTKKRENEQQNVELQKMKIQKQMKISWSDGNFAVDSKFLSAFEPEKQDFDHESYGLFTLNEMKAKQVQEKAAILIERKIDDELREKSKKKFEQQKQIQKLSFLEADNDDNNYEEDDDENNSWHKREQHKKKFKRNPDVDTSFLKDEAEIKIREELKNQWLEQQEKIKKEFIDITFSYYDGGSHRFSVKIRKGNTISEFLQTVLEKYLRNEFTELKKVTNDQLMYVKEDLILPYYYTFYDFIVRKARGKSGPLFKFDVNDDIRIASDARIEKEDSHAGKVVLRSFYERNKHIFPASRWESYDPLKTFETYTIKDTRKC